MASSMRIELTENQTVYLPGDMLSGNLSWEVGPGAERICLRLFWFTSGRGTQDIEVEEEQEWGLSGRVSGSERFQFDLPAEPYTFSGKLISVTWALEAVVFPGEQSERAEFVMSPSGQEIKLDAIEEPASC